MNIEFFVPPSHLSLLVTTVLFIIVAGCAQDEPDDPARQNIINDGLHRFVVIDPGHFHAALVFNRSGYKGISPEVKLYAPVDEDFTDHMNRVIPFNTRKNDPADWQYNVYLGEDYREAVFRERFGDIAILSGKNDTKIDNIKACIDSGFNVLADKPWVIEPDKFPVLEAVLDEAERKGLIAYDIMTERFEVSSILQKLIVAEESVFGSITQGSPDDPAVVKSSIHHLSKVVAGRQLKRPWWFFDTSVQGEGLVDITTHLVDLTFWILFPEQPINFKTDIEMGNSKHWPTLLSLDQYSTITAKPQFPEQFKLDANGKYPYFCNGQANFSVKGVNVSAEVIWNYEAPKGTGDTHYSIIKGTKANILILQEKEQNFKPELYVAPASGTDFAELGAALQSFIGSLEQYPNISVDGEKGRWRIDIPDEYRIGHEAHFGQVTDRFLKLLDGEPMPTWEKSNMLAKYYVTTKALEKCRE